MNRRPKFTYLGHSTVRVDLDSGEVVLLEPWVDGNPGCPEALKELGRVDAMLITHAHADHMGDAVALARRYEPKVVVGSYEVCQWLASQGVKNTAPMNLGGSQQVLGMRVSMVRADHSSGLSEDGSAPFTDGGIASGYVVKMPSGYTFYHAGDTALFSDMQLICELYRPELAFLPIGDLFTMDPHQAARACRFLGVREVVPIHWGTFPVLTGTPEDLGRELRDLGINCDLVRLEPGESY
jgi:L-ascorbate metabolism protein UlaG (beta-lactamase superfamily)